MDIRTHGNQGNEQNPSWRKTCSLLEKLERVRESCLKYSNPLFVLASEHTETLNVSPYLQPDLVV